MNLEDLRTYYRPYLKLRGRVPQNVVTAFKKDVRESKRLKMDMEDIILYENTKN